MLVAEVDGELLRVAWDRTRRQGQVRRSQRRKGEKRTRPAADKVNDAPQATDVGLLAVVQLLVKLAGELLDVLVELRELLEDEVAVAHAADLDLAETVAARVMSVSTREGDGSE